MKIAFYSLIVLILVLCVYFFLPQNYFEVAEDSAVPEQAVISENQPDNTYSNQDELSSEEAEVDLEFAEKQRVFEQIEKGRRNLDRSTARLKSLLWNKKLPREQADAINAELLNAHGLLKNKKLLGAFPDLAALKDELTRIHFAHNRMKQIIEEIKAQTSSD